jgi:hypothetical protein
MVPDEMPTVALSVRVPAQRMVPPFTVRFPLAFTVSALDTFKVPPELTVTLALEPALLMLRVAIVIEEVMIG